MLAAVEADDQNTVLDPAAFKDGWPAALAEGSFRLVIVLDSAPDELVQVVGYLQSVDRQGGHRPGHHTAYE